MGRLAGTFRCSKAAGAWSWPYPYWDGAIPLLLPYTFMAWAWSWPYPYWDGAIPLLLPYTFMAWRGTTLPLPLSFSALEWYSLPDEVSFVSKWVFLFLLTFWKMSTWLTFSTFPQSSSPSDLLDALRAASHSCPAYLYLLYYWLQHMISPVSLDLINGYNVCFCYVLFPFHKP